MRKRTQHQFEAKYAKELGKEGAEEIAALTIKGTGRNVIKEADEVMEDGLGQIIKDNRNLGNIIEEESDNQIKKVFKSKNNSITKNLSEQSTQKLDNISILTKERNTHGMDRHWNGTVDVLNKDTTSFFPGGQTISLDNGKSITLPNKMNKTQIEELTEEALKTTPILNQFPNGPKYFEYTTQVDKYGIRNIRVWVDETTGKILTRFPIDGPDVWRWNNNTGVFELVG